VVLDLGTGDGRAVLARAATSPNDLVIGVDASAAGMAEASRRADRRRIGNAWFLAAGVEALPGSVLAGVADLVTVTFPWGSLLRGVLGLETGALAGVAAVLAPGGAVEALVSVVPSDGIPGIPALCVDHEPAIRAAWAAAGLELSAFEPADPALIAASGSSWARRLRAGGTDRPVWRLAASIGPCDHATSSSSG
jgi:16S rRNA (adenine(1408)-N(1))-methyltransferase